MRRTLALLSALLLAGACSNDGEDPPPAATVPSEVTTSSTAQAPPDPAVIPDDLAEIDEEYVQAVVDELFAVEAKAAENFIATRDPLDKQGVTYLGAVYLDEELAEQQDVWFQALALRHHELLPGRLGADVKRIIDVKSDCVFAEVEIDFSATTTRDAHPVITFLGLTPKIEGDDPEGLNPTAWMFFSNGFNSDGSQPENPCAGR